MQSRSIDYKAGIAYGIVCIAWGSTYLGIRIGIQEMPIFLFGSARFIIAGLLILGFVLATGKKMPASRKELATIAISGFLLLVVSHGCILWAQQVVPSGLTSLILSMTPLVAAVIDYLAPGGKRLGARGWIGLLIGFGGIALLLSPGSGLQDVSLPVVLVLALSSVFWAGGTVYSSRKPVQASMFTVAALQNLFAGAALGIMGLCTGELAVFSWSWKAMYAVGFLVLVGSLMGYLAFIYVVDHMPPSIGMTYSYVNPVVAVILGSLVLGEAVTSGEILSFAIILTGVILTHSARFGLQPSISESAFRPMVSEIKPLRASEAFIQGEEGEC